MKKQSNTPQIRFHNYKELWECDRLKNIFRTIRNAFVGTATPYYVEEGHFYLESNNVKNGKINYNSQIFINDEFYEKQRDKWLKTNDIVMVQSGHVGHTAVIPKELNNTAAHALIVFTDYKKEVNPHFLNYQFQSSSKRKEINLISTGNTIKHILASEMKSFKMDFPTVEEQSAIGSLFRTLDDLLTSYKDNLANYQSLKAAMLSKMFPKAGQTIPEIRLDGFKGEWEINKLNKYLTVSKQKNTQLKFDKDDVLSVSGEFGIINQIQFQGRSFAGASVEMYSIVDTGNIVYTKSPLKANPYGIIKTNYGIPGIVSTLYAVYLPNENVFPGFVERYFENDLRLNSYLKPLVNKGAKNDMKVSDENALLGAVIFPQLEEQVAISDYFTNLDKFIQSHKDKISQLETLKKKLLQDMFI
ncbi:MULTISPECIES: restriction endonuclease subunit S [Streptococcus]|uniref:restriction endonuclease subunit S n=1 Tax=Streptococcus TaxID=1301 RepID=UPI000660B84D|nr:MULTISPECIES: restriction endonuclease subunit S [Streptococcus]